MVYIFSKVEAHLGQMAYGFNQNYFKEFKHFSLVLVGAGVVELRPNCSTKINISHVVICISRTRYARSEGQKKKKKKKNMQSVDLCVLYTSIFCAISFSFSLKQLRNIKKKKWSAFRPRQLSNTNLCY